MGGAILAFYSPYPCAGKTTAQSCLASLKNASCSSFAVPIREYVRSMLDRAGIAYDKVGKDAALPGVPNGRSFRDFMIEMGQAMRSVWPDIWVECMRREIREHRQELFVIDDLRMPNEYAMLRQEGAKIVRIVVPGRAIVSSDTEARLEDYRFDAILENPMDGIPSFSDAVRNLAQGLFSEPFSLFGHF